MWSALVVLKRNHNDAEIEKLAERFRESWSEGHVIRSWLRQQSTELRKLVREEDWSWANIGKALSAAGIQFKTGKGWTGENVRRAVDLAMKPKKVRAGKAHAPSFPMTPAVPATLLAPSAALAPARPPSEPEFRIIQRGPGPRAGESAAAVADQSKEGKA